MKEIVKVALLLIVIGLSYWKGNYDGKEDTKESLVKTRDSLDAEKSKLRVILLERDSLKAEIMLFGLVAKKQIKAQKVK